MAGDEPVDRGPTPIDGKSGEDPEAALAALAPRLRALDDAPAPDPSFVARLEEDLMDHARYAQPTRRSFAPIGGALTVAGPSTVPSEQTPRRWPLTELAVAAVVLLALVVGIAGHRLTPSGPDSGERRLGAFQPATPTAEGTPVRTVEAKNDGMPDAATTDAAPTPTVESVPVDASTALAFDDPTPTVEIRGELGRNDAEVAIPTPTVQDVSNPEPTPTMSALAKPVLDSEAVAEPALDPTSRNETIVTDLDAVLAGEPDALEEVRRQLRGALAGYESGCRAGFVLIAGNGEIGEGNALARAVEGILREDFPDLFGDAVSEVFAQPGAEPRGEVSLRIFFFEGCRPAG